mgnify:FL=1
MSDINLVAAAIEAMKKGYAPYSQFQVGAAIRDEQGIVHVGANVENAAYPQGVCAEASAISAMVMAGGQKIQAIAIAGSGEHLCTPCGGCRQRIREFANGDAVIIIADEISERARFTLATLLPHSFGPENLG